MPDPNPAPSPSWSIFVARGVPIALGVGLVIWVVLLRGATVNQPVWNVDETIHATVADVLLDGGVLYRDVIDQRTPLTYYAAAAVLAVTGSSLVALRFFTMVLIIVAAWLLGRVVGRLDGPWAGIGAALIFAALAHNLLYAGDTFAVHTEWFVVFFTAAAAGCFLTGKDAVPSLRRCGATGVCLGLAVMSKQSALLDCAPAGIALLVLARDQNLSWRAAGFRLGGLLAGALLAIMILISPSLLHGAGADLLYYTWTYNLSIYGAEFTFIEKVLSGLRLFELLWATYPILFIWGALSLLVLAARIVQFQPSERIRASRFAEVYLLAWVVTSMGSAMAGGRGFDHYFFPALLPLAWLGVWGPGQLIRMAWGAAPRPRWLQGLAVIAALGLSIPA